MREPTEAGHGHGHSPEPAAGAGASGTSGGAIAYGMPDSTYPAMTSASPLVRLGGSLGIAAASVGLLVFIAACFGFRMALVLSIIPVGLSLPGLISTLIGAVTQRSQISEDTHVLHALFGNIIGLLGGLLEMAAWLHWPIFPRCRATRRMARPDHRQAAGAATKERSPGFFVLVSPDL